LHYDERDLSLFGDEVGFGEACLSLKRFLRWSLDSKLVSDLFDFIVSVTLNLIDDELICCHVHGLLLNWDITSALARNLIIQAFKF
jgi:hypothetical protein